MTTNNIDKRIVVASNDPMEHIELELSGAIQRGYEEALKNGFKGSITDWLKTSPIDELKRIDLGGGGPVKNRPKEPKEVKKLNIADYFEVGRTVASLSPYERQIVSALVKKMLSPKRDN